MIVIDIWGGRKSSFHMARFLRPIEEAMRIARDEVVNGYLVNLRGELAWGAFHEFDSRLPVKGAKRRGAHGQVGKSEADAERATEGSQPKCK